MKITDQWLEEKRACAEGRAWFNKQKKSEAVDVLKALIKDNQLDWANWTIARVMKRKQYLAYAIYAAEQVIDIYEKKYPGNHKPRKAIEAAKAVLVSDTKETRAAAAAAYAAAAADAAYAAAAYADAYAAAYAAYAAAAAAAYAANAYADAAAAAPYAADAAAADAAAYAYADAAAANAAAANAAAAAAAYAAPYAAPYARKKMKLKILNYGLDLLIAHDFAGERKEQ